MNVSESVTEETFYNLTLLNDKYSIHEENLINFLDKIINSTIEGIVVFDENRRCIKANIPACEIFGYDMDEIIGKYAYEFVAEESKELVKNKMKIKDQYPYEAHMVRKDGLVFPALLRGKDITINSKKIRISAVVDLSYVKKKEQEIYEIAYFDKLTKLPNRQKLILDINAKKYVACVIFNIDKFGQINDLFGSEIGDMILKKLANELKKENLPVYRIGGDEFAIVFEDEINSDNLKDFILKIIKKIEKVEFVAEHEPVHIHLRAGAALNTKKLLTHADMSVRESKIRKSTFSIYDVKQKIEQRYKTNLNMTVKIHNALEYDNIVCYFQPIINNKLNVEKYEVLVRMIDNNKVISPGEFLPIAKTTKLYNDISKKVIKKACEFFSDKNVKFNINISIDDLCDDEFMDFVMETLKKTKTGSRVCFEILETEGIENYDIVGDFINNVKKLGAKIAIDDFGSGYSNFQHLLSLNIDCIKIDGSLIKNVNNNEKNKIIVETITDFAKKIGANTVAEFVCCKEIFETVKNMKIDYYQGFYFSPPLADIV